MKRDDAGYTPVSTLAYLLIVLGLAGLIIGLIAPHVDALASWHWVLGPGIALLIVGVILAIMFGPTPRSGYWYRGRP